MGNIVNRVFESSGPEGKVRGTPQQIIDKYSQLARDAQLSNDRVATENFQQHAEHYTRLLGEAQREAEARREQQEFQNRDRQRDRDDRDDARNGQDDSFSGQQERNGAGEPQRPAEEPRFEPQSGPATEKPQEQAPAVMSEQDVLDLGGESDTGLVETPENKQDKPADEPEAEAKPKPARRTRSRAKTTKSATPAKTPKDGAAEGGESDAAAESGESGDGNSATAAAE